MLANIKSNIEARYVARSPGTTDIVLSEADGIVTRAIYLNKGQEYHRKTDGRKVLLHLFQGVGALTLTSQNREEKDQLLKGDIVLLSTETSYSICNQTSAILIMSEVLL